MKHEELLAKIDKPLNKVFANHQEVKDSQAALRAVVELHKPCRIDEDMTYCEGCSNSAFFPWKYCPTIEAIEKELK